MKPLDVLANPILPPFCSISRLKNLPAKYLLLQKSTQTLSLVLFSWELAQLHNTRSSYSRCAKLGISNGFNKVLQYISERKNIWSSDDINSMTKLWLNFRYEPYQIRARDYLPGSFPHHRLTVLLLLTFNITSEGK